MDTIARQGGVSMSNNFDVQFEWKSSNSDLKTHLKRMGINFDKPPADSDDQSGSSNVSDVLKMFCEEAQLPNVQAATGSYTGRRLGEGSVNYAHSKLYTDFQLGWMCDANMTPLKFLNAWQTFIFGEYNLTGGQNVLGEAGSEIAGSGTVFAGAGKSLSQMKGSELNGERSNPAKFIRLRYPDEYQCNILITKSEKGKRSPNGRPSMMYTLMDCFPYAIDAVPLSYGASQITKVTANFYYSKYKIIYNDIRQMTG